jgi:hypothetical protein
VAEAWRQAAGQARQAGGQAEAASQAPPGEEG